MAGIALNVSQNEMPNFYPNAHSDSPSDAKQYIEPPLEIEGYIAYCDAQGEDNYSQAGDLFRLMSESQQQQLANNIAEGLVHASQEIQEIMLDQFAQADENYRVKVEKALQNI
ncbi:catalase-related domain-containing protein [Francisella noatunensis]|uniref:catalase-related domain-containing protein n=2 Tax=Francisella noatunensis TaxID=657445 RepID=UPI0027DC4CD9|nr:catalase-related domain-containing protein [Francisella noatunensis]